MIHKTLEEAIDSKRSPVIYTGYFEYAHMADNKIKDWRYCDDFIRLYTDALKDYVDGLQTLGVMPNYTVVNNVLLKHPEYKYVS